MKNEIVVGMLSEMEDELFSGILSGLENVDNDGRRIEGES